MSKSILEQLEYLIAQSPDGPGIQFIAVERSRLQALIDVARAAEFLVERELSRDADSLNNGPKEDLKLALEKLRGDGDE